MECYQPIISEKDKLSSGCHIIDRFLGGGFCCKELTELSGEASAGKTQLCLQLVLATVLHCERWRAVYIHTEGDPPLSRLSTLTFSALANSKRSEDMNKQEAAQIMNRVYVEHGFDTGEDLMNRLVGLESLLSTSLTSNKEVKLLVIDSIAYLFRDIGDDDKASYSLVGRSMIFFRISSLLRSFAEKYNLAVVVTNHVVDAFHLQAASLVNVEKTEASPGCGGLCLMSSGRAMYPALGLAWANCITSRLFVFRVTQVNNLNELCRVLHSSSDHERRETDKSDKSLSQVRGIQVVFCPRLPQSLCYFTLHHAGKGVIGLLPKEMNESTNFILSPMNSYAI